jgi:hypothetical protein
MHRNELYKKNIPFEIVYSLDIHGYEINKPRSAYVL